jgi:alkylation response protein AidB-like acyl-CoA dehydrogenase
VSSEGGGDAGELDLLRRTIRDLLAAGGARVQLSELGELGLLGLLVPEERGGAGWCPVEAAVMAEEVGRAAAAGGATSPGGSGATVAWLVTTIAAAGLAVGDSTDALLVNTLEGTRAAAAVAGRVDLVGGAARGTLTGVEGADEAPAVVVVEDGGDLALVDLGGGGVTVRPDPTSIDTTRSLWRVDLDGVPAVSLGSAQQVQSASLVLAAAEQLGSLRAALERLVPYLSDRVAFGAPVASFQAIQHRIVELTLIEVRAGVAVAAAARHLATDGPAAAQAAAVAHAYVTEHVPPVLDDCVQLTGGIGFTWEYPLHHELRRSVGDAAVFGSARSSRERLLALAGWA